MKFFLALCIVTFSYISLCAQKPVFHLASTHHGLIYDAGFIPGRSLIYSIGEDNTFRLWDFYSGHELLKREIPNLRDAAVSCSGSFIAILSANALHLFSTLNYTTKIINRDSTYRSVNFTAAGNILVCCDDRIEEWTPNGRIVRTSKFKYQKEGRLEEFYVLPDGKTILIASLYPARLELINRSDRWKHTFELPELDEPLFALSQDGKFLACYDSHRINTYELPACTLISSIPFEKLASITIAPDNSRILTNDSTGRMRTYELLSGKKLKTFPVPYKGLEFFASKDTAEYFGYALDELNITNSYIWVSNRYGTGNLAIQNTLMNAWGGFDFDREKENMFVYTKGQTASIWNFRRNSFVERHIGSGVFLQPDLYGNSLKEIGYDSTTGTTEFEYSTGTIIKSTALPANNSFKWRVEAFNADRQLMFASDANAWDISGSMLLIAGNQPEIHDLDKGRRQRVYESGEVTAPTRVLFSETGKYFFANRVLFETSTGKAKRFPGLDYLFQYVGFLNEDQFVVYDDLDHNVKVADINSTQVIKEFKGHHAGIMEAKFLDNNTFVTGSVDGAIKFWNFTSQQEIATLYVIDSANWVVTSPGGLFDATDGAMDVKSWRMYYVVTDTSDQVEPFKVINIQQLKQRYYQPNLLAILLGLSRESVRDVPDFDKIQLAPTMSASLDGDKIMVNLKNQGGGIGRLSVFIDGAEVVDDARLQNTENQNIDQLTVEIDLTKYATLMKSDEDNMLRFVSWNDENWLSSTPITIPYRPDPAGAKGIPVVRKKNTNRKQVGIHGLMVGTADYAGDDIDLKFAAKDAKDFYRALRLVAEELAGAENVNLTLLTTDEQHDASKPTKKNITAVLKALQETKPDDVVILYFSGHGVNYGGQDGDFYYLTSNCPSADEQLLKDATVRETSTLSSRELADILNKIPARKKILILDACAAGKAAEVMVNAARDVPASQTRALDRLAERTGFYVLSGSAADAVSYETTVYGQGLLTYALLKAIRGAALRVDAGHEYVDVQTLLQYAVEEVPILARGVGGIQQPLFRSPDNQRSYDIGKVTTQIKQQITLAEPKPVFTPSSFIEPVHAFDTLRLSETLDATMDEISARGRPAEIIYTRAKGYPNAYELSGTYTITGEDVIVNFRIRKNSKSAFGPLSITGKRRDVPSLVAKIVEEARIKILSESL